ncbi:MAG: hypothetical protein FJY55_15365, partial [Betaproteobacteria bacterium]|nr:hypothetical protein [Betaproteobacteria bacterium]
MKAAGACLDKDSLASFAVDSVADIFGDLAGSAAESTLESLRHDGNFHSEAALAEALAKALEFAREELPVANACPLTTWRKRLLDASPDAREGLFVTTDPTDPTQLTAELTPEQWWDQMLPSLLRWSNGEGIPADTCEFLRPRLYSDLRKAYLHLLRDPRHGKAWIAYQQRFLEAIAAAARTDHGDLADRIEALARDTNEMQSAVIAELERQTERVLDAVAGVSDQVAALDGKLDRALIRIPEPARLHNIPAPTAHFTGRAHHLE